MTKISVIMPVFNAEKFVRKSISSILNQTFKDYEFIIINDGSTDGSLAILREFAALDSRIRLISRPNTGIVGALNEGIDAAKGVFIARMDADDLCDPARFQLQLDRIEQDPQLVLVGSCAFVIDAEGDQLGTADVPLTHEAIEESHLQGTTTIFHPAVIMRAEAVRQVGCYRKSAFPCEDFDLWLRLGEIGRLANMRERLFTWRKTTDGIVTRNTHRMQETIRNIVKDAWLRRNLAGEPQICEAEPLSDSDLMRQWAWGALRCGHRRSARKYALRSVFRNPLSAASWTALACAIRGR